MDEGRIKGRLFIQCVFGNLFHVTVPDFRRLLACPQLGPDFRFVLTVLFCFVLFSVLVFAGCRAVSSLFLCTKQQSEGRMSWILNETFKNKYDA